MPRDRHARGIVPLLSVAENMTMTIVERLGPAGIMLPPRQADAASRMVRSLQIVAASTEQPIKELSGGNQQKAVMARALASDAQGAGAALSDPGRRHRLEGGAVRDRRAGSRRRHRRADRQSDELDELSVCDRVLVIFKGRLTAEFPAGWESEALVAAIEGIGHGERAG